MQTCLSGVAEVLLSGQKVCVFVPLCFYFYSGFVGESTSGSAMCWTYFATCGCNPIAVSRPLFFYGKLVSFFSFSSLKNWLVLAFRSSSLVQVVTRTLVQYVHALINPGQEKYFNETKNCEHSLNCDFSAVGRKLFD